jgi:hypothetical protein
MMEILIVVDSLNHKANFAASARHRCLPMGVLLAIYGHGDRTKKAQVQELKELYTYCQIKNRRWIRVSDIENSHIDFWMFETFDPVAAVVHVEGL